MQIDKTCICHISTMMAILRHKITLFCNRILCNSEGGIEETKFEIMMRGLLESYTQVALLLKLFGNTLRRHKWDIVDSCCLGGICLFDPWCRLGE
jgi:hypothetical protein